MSLKWNRYFKQTSTIVKSLKPAYGLSNCDNLHVHLHNINVLFFNVKSTLLFVSQKSQG